ncbi:MAG: FAD-dependent oxidoreductase, partial [Firmicutes bacterium]|nr:FAD-dependent oxidoreductase [Bacillota bacterium]
AYDILDGSVVAGRDVIVIGGGSVGCETAQFMAHEASVSPEQVYHMLANKYMPFERVLELMNSTRRNISVVDVVKVGSGFQLGTGWPVLGDMKRLGVRSYSFAATRSIKDGVATLDVKKAKDSDETEEVKIPVDTVVMSVGALPNEGLYDELAAYFGSGEDAGVKVYNIGDSAGIANVKSAVEAGCRLAEEIG